MFHHISRRKRDEHTPRPHARPLPMELCMSTQCLDVSKLDDVQHKAWRVEHDSHPPEHDTRLCSNTTLVSARA